MTNYMAEPGVAMMEELIDAVKTSSSYNGSCKPWKKNPEVSNESVPKRLTNHGISLE